jgi:hypothetical protein
MLLAQVKALLLIKPCDENVQLYLVLSASTLHITVWLHMNTYFYTLIGYQQSHFVLHATNVINIASTGKWHTAVSFPECSPLIARMHVASPCLRPRHRDWCMRINCVSPAPSPTTPHGGEHRKEVLHRSRVSGRAEATLHNPRGETSRVKCNACT